MVEVLCESCQRPLVNVSPSSSSSSPSTSSTNCPTCSVSQSSALEPVQIISSPVHESSANHSLNNVHRISLQNDHQIRQQLQARGKTQLRASPTKRSNSNPLRAPHFRPVGIQAQIQQQIQQRLRTIQPHPVLSNVEQRGTIPLVSVRPIQCVNQPSNLVLAPAGAVPYLHPLNPPAPATISGGCSTIRPAQPAAYAPIRILSAYPETRTPTQVIACSPIQVARVQPQPRYQVLNQSLGSPSTVYKLIYTDSTNAQPTNSQETAVQDQALSSTPQQHVLGGTLSNPSQVVRVFLGSNQIRVLPQAISSSTMSSNRRPIIVSTTGASGSVSFPAPRHVRGNVYRHNKIRVLRSAAAPSDPTPVVIDEEEDAPPPAKVAGSSTTSEVSSEDAQNDFCEVTVVRPPDGESDKGEYSVIAEELRIGSFLLKKRKVTFSQNKLVVRARTRLSRIPEVRLVFESGDIIKVVWSLLLDTPAAFFNMSPKCRERVQETLKLEKEDSSKDPCSLDDAQFPHFEPTSSSEKRKRIIIILEKRISEEFSERIRDCYQSPKENIRHVFGTKLLQMCESNCAYYETPTPGELRSGIIPNGPAKLASSGPSRTPSRIQSSDAFTEVFENSDNITNLCRYPPEGTGCSIVTTADLTTLNADAFLNDSVIDFYLRYLHGEVLPKDVAERTFMFNTFFYSTLVKTSKAPTEGQRLSIAKRRHNNVKRWTKDVDLFSKDFLLIPVCQNSHWFLIIVAYPWLVPVVYGHASFSRDSHESPMDIDESASGGPESSIDEQHSPKKSTAGNGKEVSPHNTTQNKLAAVYVFDSLRGSVNESTVYAIIREYLQEELLAKKGISCKFEFTHMRGFYPHVPQQPNFHDCGIFVLEFAKCFLQRPPKINGVGGSKQFKYMFDPDVVSENGRAEVSEVILKLHEKQNPGTTVREQYEKYLESQKELSINQRAGGHRLILVEKLP